MAFGVAKEVKDRRPRSPSGRPRFRRSRFGQHIPITGSGATIRSSPDGGGIFGGSRPLDESGPGGHLAPQGVRTRSIVVLLPALNEEMAVGSVIERIPMEPLKRAGYDVYVWVVDGRSVDGTPEVARDRGASIYVQSGAGKGNGVRQALDHLMHDRSRQNIPGPKLYVMLDADGTYPPEQIPEFVEALESGCDVVAGSRLRGRIEDGAFTSLNRLGNEALSGFARFLFGFPISDVCTGMWAFREDALQHFRLVAESFDLEADIFASACEVGAHMKELPVDYACRIGEAKLVPLRTGLLIAWRLLMRRLNTRDIRELRRSPVTTQAGRAVDQ
jgi:glycosyltransferase involved in cell wall biosynthesis